MCIWDKAACKLSPPILAVVIRYYTGGAAVIRIVQALAGRPVTQARDVFDIAFLIRGGHSPPDAWSQMLADGE
jgi:hypothetical protein